MWQQQNSSRGCYATEYTTAGIQSQQLGVTSMQLYGCCKRVVCTLYRQPIWDNVGQSEVMLTDNGWEIQNGRREYSCQSKRMWLNIVLMAPYWLAIMGGWSDNNVSMYTALQVHTFTQNMGLPYWKSIIALTHVLEYLEHAWWHCYKWHASQDLCCLGPCLIWVDGLGYACAFYVQSICMCTLRKVG